MRNSLKIQLFSISLIAGFTSCTNVDKSSENEEVFSFDTGAVTLTEK